MALRVPILTIDEFLIVSIQVALDDHSVMQLQEDLLSEVTRTEAHGVILDLTAVDIVDSFMARSLDDLATSVRLLGAQMAIVGIQPTVAIPLVRMGLKIHNAATALNLQRGLIMLRKKVANEGCPQRGSKKKQSPAQDSSDRTAPETDDGR